MVSHGAKGGFHARILDPQATIAKVPMNILSLGKRKNSTKQSNMSWLNSGEFSVKINLGDIF